MARSKTNARVIPQPKRVIVYDDVATYTVPCCCKGRVLLRLITYRNARLKVGPNTPHSRQFVCQDCQSVLDFKIHE